MRNKRDKFYKVHGWTLTQMQMPTFLLRRLHLGPAIATLLPFVCHFPPPHGMTILLEPHLWIVILFILKATASFLKLLS